MTRTPGKYSQNNEDLLIEKYFEGRTGSLLSLGENDGKTLSNSLYAIERGWSAVLVEPSEKAYEKLIRQHKLRPDVICYNVAIGEINGDVEFFESGEHIGGGDTALISTLVKSETERWKGSRFDNFTQTIANCFTWPTFYHYCPVKKFNLVSIDCEGLDYFILSQMNLTEMGCEMLIVEFNGKEKEKYVQAAQAHGLRLYESNAENLIFVK